MTGDELPSIDIRQPRRCDDDWVASVFVFDINVASDGSAEQRTIMFAYDEVYSIEYFGLALPPYWRHEFNTPEALITAFARPVDLLEKIHAYQTKILDMLTNVGGDQYATVLSLAYRQTTGGTVTVWSEQHNSAWIFMKEISSDGDVSTVDVIYPSSPMWLLLAPESMRLILLPLLEYANNQTNVLYNLPWAPHHLGVWPICDLRADEQEQMPMEETANFLIMLATVVQQQQGEIGYLQSYWPLLQTWASYLNSSLPDPGNQLCTDDFEGASPHNANLAAKGIVGLAAYGRLLEYRGLSDDAAMYYRLAQRFSMQWQSMANDTDHFRLQYDLPNTWSLKYNLLFNYVLGFGDTIFPAAVIQTDINYLTSKHLNTFGIPLDNRAIFTKTDWLSWIAAMATPDQFSLLFNAIYNFANTTPTRVAFSDWYFTDSGVQKGFKARPVMGGLFAKSLIEDIRNHARRVDIVDIE
jgi:hypothetical protein